MTALSYTNNYVIFGHEVGTHPSDIKKDNFNLEGLLILFLLQKGYMRMIIGQSHTSVKYILRTQKEVSELFMRFTSMRHKNRVCP